MSIQCDLEEIQRRILAWLADNRVAVDAPAVDVALVRFGPGIDPVIRVHVGGEFLADIPADAIEAHGMGCRCAQATCMQDALAELWAALAARYLQSTPPEPEPEPERWTVWRCRADGLSGREHDGEPWFVSREWVYFRRKVGQ